MEFALAVAASVEVVADTFAVAAAEGVDDVLVLTEEELHIAVDELLEQFLFCSHYHCYQLSRHSNF